MGEFSVSNIVIQVAVVRTGKAELAKLQKELNPVTEGVKQLNKETEINSKVAKSAAEAQSSYTDTVVKGAWGTKSATTETKHYYDEQRKGMVTLKETTQNNMGLIDTMNALRWSMVNVAFAGAFIAGLAKPFYDAAKAAGEFEVKLKRIQAVTGAMPEEAGKVILEAREGRPISASETSDAFLEFAKAGFSASETADALVGILDLAQAGMMELGDAASLTAQVMSQFSSETLTASEIADVLVVAADTSRASVEGLGNALSYVGPFAEALGISLKESLAALEILIDRGLNGSKAATSFRQALSAMMDPSEGAKKALKELGVELYDSAGNFKGIDAVVREFSVALKDLPLEEQNRLMGSIFEVRAMAAMNNLIAAFDNANISVAAYVEGLDKVGAAHEKALTMQEANMLQLKSGWEDLKSSSLAFGFAILNGVTPYLVAAMKVFKELMSTDTSVYARFGAIAPEVKEVTKEFEDQNKSMKELSAEYEKSIGILKNLQAELTVASNKGRNFVESLSGAVADLKVDTDFYKTSDKLKEVYEGFVNFENVEGAPVAAFNKLGLAIGMTIVEIYGSERAIELLTESKKELEKIIKQNTADLATETEILKALKDEYASITQRIKELSKVRFQGESATLNILERANIWLKKEELATLGVADAQAFINEQLGKTNNEYDDMFAKLSSINSEMNKNQDAFKAWQETIKTAISAEVEAGESLSKDVTSRVKTWQTMLLGISSFSGASSGKTGLDEYINKLQLAFDVNFGGMKQEVGAFVRTQEDTINGTYGSSTEVIRLLGEEYAKLPPIIAAIAEKQQDVDSLTEILKTNKAELVVITDLIIKEEEEIQRLLTTLEPLATAFEKLLEKINEINAAIEAEKKRLFSIEAKKVLDTVAAAAGGPEVPQEVIDMFDILKKQKTVYEGNTIGNPSLAKERTYSNDLVQDALIRPGMRPVKFHPNDTIMATKGGGMGNNVNVSVNMNATGNLNYDVYQLAREIKRQLAQ